jgi:hypothetical protein
MGGRRTVSVRPIARKSSTETLNRTSAETQQAKNEYATPDGRYKDFRVGLPGSFYPQSNEKRPLW